MVVVVGFGVLVVMVVVVVVALVVVVLELVVVVAVVEGSVRDSGERDSYADRRNSSWWDGGGIRWLVEVTDGD